MASLLEKAVLTLSTCKASLDMTTNVVYRRRAAKPPERLRIPYHCAADGMIDGETLTGKAWPCAVCGRRGAEPKALVELLARAALYCDDC